MEFGENIRKLFQNFLHYNAPALFFACVLNVIFDLNRQQAVNAPDFPVIPTEIERAVSKFVAVALELVDFQLDLKKNKNTMKNVNKLKKLNEIYVNINCKILTIANHINPQNIKYKIEN